MNLPGLDFREIAGYPIQPHAMSSPSNPSRRTRLIWVLIISLLVVLAGVGLAVWYAWRPILLPEAISQQEYRNAVRHFRDLYRRTPSHVEVCSLAGELAIKEGRLTSAIACFGEIPSTDPRYGASARLQEGQVWLRLNQAGAAELSFREFLRVSNTRPVSPEHLIAAYKWLVYILSVELRFEDRLPVLAEMHELGLADVFDSKQFHFPNLLIWNSPAGRHRLQQFQQQDPDNFRLRIVLGRYLTADGKLTEAQRLLEELHRREPADVNCLAALAECYFEQNDWARFTELVRTWPKYQAEEPWLLTRLRGEFANHQHNWSEAILQFERVQKVDPANPWSQMGLARAYAGLGRQESREQALQRSLVLSNIRVDLMTVKENRPKAALELANLCQQVGLTDAVETFRLHAARSNPVNRPALPGAN